MIHRFIDLPSVTYGPPFGAAEGSSLDGDYNVYRTYVGAPDGSAKNISGFNDGALTSEGVHNPTISPDRSKILFEVDNASTGLNEIWVVAAKGGTPTQLVGDGTNRAMHPSWGPDSDTFVYHLTNGSATSGGSILLDTVSNVGSPTTLKSASGGSSPYRPQINHDGTKVAYLFDKDVGSGAELRIVDPDGTNDTLLDTITNHRGQGPQFGWANSANKIAYDTGATGSNGIYVINSDGTGKTQINANGDAAGAACRVSRMSWPPDDSYVVISANNAIITGQFQVCKAELDGSTTTGLNSSHGPSDNSANFWNEALVFEGRIWFIEQAVTGGMVASFAMDGTGYRVDLDVTQDTLIDNFANGDGWSFT